jgi:hypothetical protein
VQTIREGALGKCLYYHATNDRYPKWHAKRQCTALKTKNSINTSFGKLDNIKIRKRYAKKIGFLLLISYKKKLYK